MRGGGRNCGLQSKQESKVGETKESCHTKEFPTESKVENPQGHKFSIQQKGVNQTLGLNATILDSYNLEVTKKNH